MLSVKSKIRLARVLNRGIRGARKACGLPMRTICRRRGIRWELDLDEGIDLCIYVLGAYEGAVLRTYKPLIKPGDVVFDVGANVGCHTLHFAKLVGEHGTVHAFEPTDFAFAKLLSNLALNPLLARRILPHQLFVCGEAPSALPAQICSSWPVDRWTADVVRDELDERHLGRANSLDGAKAIQADEFCVAEGIDRLDFLKIDVDGYEFDVIRGFRAVLARLRPKIIIELAPFVHGQGAGNTFDDLVSFLAGLEYDFFDAITRRPIPASGAGLRSVIATGSSINGLLLPRAR